MRPFALFAMACLGACAADRYFFELPLQPAELGEEQRLEGEGLAPTIAANRTVSGLASFDASMVDRLRAPPGFSVSVFAEGIENARVVAVDRRTGFVYVTSPKTGSVYLVEAGHRRADHPRIAIKGLARVHGIAIRGERVWLSGHRQIWTAEIMKDGTFGAPRVLVADLPEGGLHPNRTLGFDPSGRLYVSIGSGCDACAEDNPEHGTIISMTPEGAERRIVARGLRNTIGFDWHPRTGALWGMDRGSTGRGAEAPAELNELVEGGSFGWPYSFGKREIDPRIEAPGKISKEALVERSVGSVLEYPAKSSPSGMVFYRGSMFPADYQGDAFVAFRGPRQRGLPVGYKVVRIHFEGDRPTGTEDFLTGFVDGENVFGRLSGLEIANDGSLLVADQRHGIVYRVARDVMGAKN